MTWTRRKIGAAVLAAGMLLGGAAAVIGMSHDGAPAGHSAMSFNGNGG